MAFFSKNPVSVPEPVNEYGFADPKEDTYHCACGYSTKNSAAMDRHITKEHSDG